MLSIIIAYHNEGLDFITETVKNIKDTVDVEHEIIIVDDFSDIPLQLDGVTVLRHPKNLGVGTAFDTGVRAASFEKLFLMGCDVRFSNNGWASRMEREISQHPRSLICTSVVPLSRDYPEITFEVAKKALRLDLYRGATMRFFIDGENRHILEAEWHPREFLPLRHTDYVPPVECYEIACILGAAYGTNKTWYKYIDGFWGHKFWGTLEPLISLKCWLFGGSCLVAPTIETAHYFNVKGSHAPMYNYGLYKAYNRMLTAWLLFPKELREKLIDFMTSADYVDHAKLMIRKNLKVIKLKRLEYAVKAIMSIDEYIEKFNIR